MSWAGVLWPTAALLPRLAGGAEAPSVLHGWARCLLPALGLDVSIQGRLRTDVPLWVANHLSWVDPVVFLSLRPMGTIAKREVLSYPILGRLARRSGMQFVDRTEPTSRAAALVAFCTALRGGRDMLLFPEGTTTRGGRLAPLYAGGLHAAYELGIPAQPLRIDSPAAHYPWTGDETLLPHLRTLLGTRTPVVITAGAALYPSDYPDPLAWLAAFQAALTPRSLDVR